MLPRAHPVATATCGPDADATRPLSHFHHSEDQFTGGGGNISTSEGNGAATAAGPGPTASSVSNKFEEAMEMYQQSMAIRRSKISMSGNSNISGEETSQSRDSKDTSSVKAPSEPSPRGPQLRSNTRLACVNPSGSAQQLPPLPSTSNASSISPPQQTSLEASSKGPRSGASQHVRASFSHLTSSPFSANTAVSTSPTPTVANPITTRRSTRRPVSRLPSASPNSVGSWKGGGPLSPTQVFSSFRRSILSSSSMSHPEGDNEGDNGSGPEKKYVDRYGSAVQVPPLHRITTGMSHTATKTQAGSPLSSLSHSPHGGSRPTSKSPTCDASALTMIPRRASHDSLIGGSYDVPGLQAMLDGESDEDGGGHDNSGSLDERPSPYLPAVPTTAQQQQQQQQQQQWQRPSQRMAPPKPASPPASVRLSGYASRVFKSPAPASPSKAILVPPVTAVAQTSATAAAASRFSLQLPPLPQHQSSTTELPTMKTALPRSTPATRKARPPSSPPLQHHPPPHKADATTRSATQAGLSSNVMHGKSRDRNGSAAVVGAAGSGADAPNGRVKTRGEAPSVLPPHRPLSSAAKLDVLPTPPPANSSNTAAGVAPQAAKFYTTASLTKTADGAQFLNDCILLGDIGSGATGKVKLAFSTSMNRSVAIKIIQKPRERKCRLLPSRVSSASLSGVSLHSGQRVLNESAGMKKRKGGEGSNDGRLDLRDKKTRGTQPDNSTTLANARDRYKETVSSTSTFIASPVHKAGGSGSSALPLTTAERETRNLQHEIDVMRDLDHPNIVRLYEVINDPKSNSLFLVLQYVDGGAVAHIDSSGHIERTFAPDEVLALASQVSDGLVYLHEHRIVHRDIKPENILMNRDGHVFLADFGVAELQNAESGLPTVATLAYQGTPLFMAPEVYGLDEEEAEDPAAGDVSWWRDESDVPDAIARDKRQNTARAAVPKSSATGDAGGEVKRPPRTIDPYALDVWALGVTLFTLLVGYVPFSSIIQIRQTFYDGVKVIPHDLPAAWRTVLQRTLEPEPAKRISSLALRDMLHAMQAEKEREEQESATTGGGGSRTADRYSSPKGHSSRHSSRVAARGGGGGGGGAGGSRPSQPAPRHRIAQSVPEEEDVILGSCTPPEAMPLDDGAGETFRLDDSLSDKEDNHANTFSLDSSVLNVLLPPQR